MMGSDPDLPSSLVQSTDLLCLRGEVRNHARYGYSSETFALVSLSLSYSILILPDKA